MPGTTGRRCSTPRWRGSRSRSPTASTRCPGATSRRVLRLAGGGSTHPAWRALLANALRAELHAVDTPAASARGAALLGAVAAGVLDEGDLSTAAVAHTTLVAEPGAGAAALEPRRARFHRVLAALRDQRAIGFESR
jgi:sugar (pentulose or hexulose) kinase